MRVGEGVEAAEEARVDAQDGQPADLDCTSLRNLLSLLKQQQSSLSALEVEPSPFPFPSKTRITNACRNAAASRPSGTGGMDRISQPSS